MRTSNNFLPATAALLLFITILSSIMYRVKQSCFINSFPLPFSSTSTLTSTVCHQFRPILITPSINSKYPQRRPISAMKPFQWAQKMFSQQPATAISPPANHAVLGNPIAPPKDGWKAPLKEAMFGLGCFWGAERKFWNIKGVYTTSVGYAGGSTPNPGYRQVCSGMTGHAEVVNVVFNENKTSYEKLLNTFWEAHDPTTKDRQGNDVGTQYRSVIFFYNDEQKKLAEETRDHFNSLLKEAGRNAITTEILPAPQYNYAEEYHQQYLHKNPMGYCGLGGTGLFSPRD